MCTIRPLFQSASVVVSLTVCTGACADGVSNAEALSSTVAQCRADPAAEDARVSGDESGAGRCSGPAYTRARPLGVGYRDQLARGPLPDHVAYLTFDDGPSEWTRDFLAILSAKNVRATFFLNAHNLKGDAGLDGTYTDADGSSVSFREVLADIVAAGHVIGNHTVDHLDLATLSLEEAAAQLDENERLINAALVRSGMAPRPLTLVRPPWGSPWYTGRVALPDVAASQEVIGPLLSLRGFNVLWNLDSRDSLEWAVSESFTRRQDVNLMRDESLSYDDKVQRTRRNVLESPIVQAGRGALILLHDTHDTTRDALPDILDGLVAQGYGFATVEEYVKGRFARSSLELTPGPGLYDVCEGEAPHSCASFGERPSVCGRMWRAFESFGAEAQLGLPTGELVGSDSSQVVAQRFERGTLELRPQAAAPCDMVLVR